MQMGSHVDKDGDSNISENETAVRVSKEALLPTNRREYPSGAPGPNATQTEGHAQSVGEITSVRARARFLVYGAELHSKE